MARVQYVEHRDVKKYIDLQRGRRVAHLVVHRNEGKINVYLGTSVTVGTACVLNRYSKGPDKLLPIEEREALNLAKKIYDIDYRKAVDIIVIDCTYSVTVARAICKAANIMMHKFPVEEMENEIMDKKVYDAMVEAFDKVIRKEAERLKRCN